MFVALDVGTRRVGIARSDEGNLIATPVGAFTRKAALVEIIGFITNGGVEGLVVGLPLGERGERTEQCLDVERFCRRIERRVKVALIYVDEYMSSVEARAELGMESKPGRRTRQTGLVDAMSAKVILQAFLDARSAKR